MDKEYQVRLSGYGGQGIILAGIILGEAVSLYENRFAVQYQSYGPEARGGASKAEVVISDHEIDLLELSEPDFFLALSQQAYDKYIEDTNREGIVIIDPDYVKNASSKWRYYEIPISRIAREQVGKVLVTNMVALGAFAAISGLVSLDSLTKAVLKRVPPGTEESNTFALEKGYEIAKTAMEQSNNYHKAK